MRRRIPVVELCLLGSFRLRAEGVPVVLHGKRDRALLAFLALHPARPHRRLRLAEMLWGEAAADARHNLRQSLSQIVAALDRVEPGASALLQSTRDEILLGNVGVDAQRFQALSQSRTLRDLEAAAALYLAPFLDAFGPVSPAFDAWLTLERERLGACALGVHRSLRERYASVGSPEKALPLISRLAEMDPTKGEVRRELMLAHAECGDVSAALSQYAAYAELLRRDLGVEPDRSTRELARLLNDGIVPGRAARRMQMAAGRRERAPIDDFLEASVSVLEQMPDCIVVTDLEGRIVGWNQWARRNFGYEKREVVGRKPSFLYGPGADASMTAELISKAVRHGRWSGVLRLFGKDGSSRLHKRTMLPLRDSGGRVVGVFGVTRPLTRPIPGL